MCTELLASPSTSDSTPQWAHSCLGSTRRTRYYPWILGSEYSWLTDKGWPVSTSAERSWEAGGKILLTGCWRPSNSAGSPYCISQPWMWPSASTMDEGIQLLCTMGIPTRLTNSEPPPRGCVLHGWSAAAPANSCPLRVAAQLVGLWIKPTAVMEWRCTPSMMSVTQYKNKPGLVKFMLPPLPNATGPHRLAPWSLEKMTRAHQGPTGAIRQRG